MLMDSFDDPEQGGLLASLDGVKFRRPVVPGDQLRFELELLHPRAHLQDAGTGLRGWTSGLRGSASMMADGIGSAASPFILSALIDPTAELGSGVWKSARSASSDRMSRWVMAAGSRHEPLASGTCASAIACR